MAVAMVMEWQGMNQDQYEQVLKVMELDDDPPDGGIFHIAGPGLDGWRVIDIWESQEAFERFQSERIAPAAAEAGLLGEPRIQIFPIHNIYAPGVEEIQRIGATSLPSGARV
jgi:hypothetical protein